MKNKVINSILALALVGLFVMTIKTYDVNDTIDAFTGATPTNSVIDAIVGATSGFDDDEDDEHDEHEEDDD